MIKKLLLLALVLALGGCANTYTLDGVKYDSKETFHQAIDKSNLDALTSIKPLLTPVTKKNLIIALPSEGALYTENISRVTKSTGQIPSGLVLEQIVNLTKANFNMSKVFADAVQKKKIYATSKFIEMSSMNGSLEPSVDTDVLYFSEPAIGSGQWFFATQKYGK